MNDHSQAFDHLIRCFGRNSAWRFAISRSITTRGRAQMPRERVRRLKASTWGSRTVGTRLPSNAPARFSQWQCRWERFFSRSARGFPPSSAWAMCVASELESWKKTCVPTERIAARISAGYWSRNWLAETTATPNFRASERSFRCRCPKATRFWISSAVHGEERTFLAGEKCILQNRKDQAAERKRLLAKSSLFQIHNDPVPSSIACFIENVDALALRYDGSADRP